MLEIHLLLSDSHPRLMFALQSGLVPLWEAACQHDIFLCTMSFFT